MSIFETLDDATCRMEKIFHIASQINSGQMPDELQEEFEEDGEKICEAIGISNPFEDEDLEEYECCEILEETLYARNKIGFLCLAATPIPSRFSSPNSYIYSWGLYRTQWLYAESYHEVCEKAAQWAKDFRAKKYQESLAD